MLRIRFHGRGGQGMKTASRILGSAAFHAGFVVQDSPIYGAERRGAPMAAFTRIARDTIRERGIISQPDLIVVADASLLIDQAAQPLSGCRATSTVLINSDQTQDAIQDALQESSSKALSKALPLITPLAQHLHVANFTKTTKTILDHTHTLAGLSTALGAAAGALIGLSLRDVLAGVDSELAATHLSVSQRAANTRLAQVAYTIAAAWPCVQEHMQEQQQATLLPASPLVNLSFESPRLAAPSIYAVGNSPERRTGNWRQFRPVLHPEQCTRCWICFVRCPEAAISLDEKEYPVIDYTECKGCLLCAHECPTQAFSVEEEENRSCPDNS